MKTVHDLRDTQSVCDDACRAMLYVASCLGVLAPHLAPQNETGQCHIIASRKH